MPSYRPPDYLIQERLKKDAEIENLEDFTRYDKTCFMKNSWLKSSENRFVRGAIQRQVRDVFVQQEVLLQEKKERSVCCQYIILGWGGTLTPFILLSTNVYLLAQTLHLPFFIRRQFFVKHVCVETRVCLSRLRELLEAEEKQHLQEIEAKKETSVQRQEKMKEYIKALRERREKERQQLVSDKLEQLFR